MTLAPADLLFATILVLASALAVLITRRAQGPAVPFIAIAAATAIAWAIVRIAAPSFAVATVAIATVSAALALAAFRDRSEPSSAVAAVVLLVAAIVSASGSYFGWTMASVLPVLLASIAITVVAALGVRTSLRDSLLLLASAAALIASAAVDLRFDASRAMPFAAAATLGVALAVSPASRLAVDNKRGWKSRRLAVRRKR